MMNDLQGNVQKMFNQSETEKWKGIQVSMTQSYSCFGSPLMNAPTKGATKSMQEAVWQEMYSNVMMWWMEEQTYRTDKAIPIPSHFTNSSW